jgi:glycosyltransferase involved in cell wall biosynthesis
MSHNLSPIKVLHIIDGFGMGGAETWLLSLVKYLNTHPELNIKFDFLATGGAKVILDDEILNLGSNIFYCKYSLIKIRTFSKFFKKVLKQNKYDVIHNHQDFISGWHFLSAIGQLPSVRISHLHNPYYFVDNYLTSPYRIFSFLIGRFLMFILSTKITGTSNFVMDEYGYDRFPYKIKRLQPAYCGFEIKKFSFNRKDSLEIKSSFNWSPEVRIALFVGRIGILENSKAPNQKNPSFAFKIAKDLVSKHKNWNFIFVGNKGTLGNVLEKEVELLGLTDRIKFAGIRYDMPALYSASDILIFPSFCEGLGMVVVEAQANGLKVLASNSVPKEAFIFPELVITKSVTQSVDEWVNEILITNIVESDIRQQYNISLHHSIFSIESSIKYLLTIYYK